jgi:hypothetical protein
MFVESNRPCSLEDNYKLNSRLIKMMRGLLYISEKFDIHADAKTIVKRFIEKYAYLFNKEEIDVIRNLVKKSRISSNTSNMSEKYFTIRFSIINKIHKEALKTFYNL